MADPVLSEKLREALQNLLRSTGLPDVFEMRIAYDDDGITAMLVKKWAGEDKTRLMLEAIGDVNRATINSPMMKQAKREMEWVESDPDYIKFLAKKNNLKVMQ